MEINGRIIVTGATGGMGAAAVEALAKEGHPVLMACRNLKKADTVRASILNRIPGADLDVKHLDLASMASVRAFADSIEPGSVSALFNNAGVISRGFSITGDGLENTFSVNYFGPWLLTRLLLPKLPQDAHIVNMVSLTCRFVSIDKAALQPTEKDFRQLVTYAKAKRAMVSFSQELARRYPLLHVNMADPGVVGTDMIDLGWWFDPIADVLVKPLFKTPQSGVQPALRALREEKQSHYYVGKQSKAIPARYINPSLDKSIWEETQKIIKL
jgi:NAD(P)-dependent dehydrogenase (short-subunit alcohol dehydrogenase family)